MPIYEFKCHDCGSISEKLLLGGERAEDICCSRCGSLKVNRVLSAPSSLTKSSAPNSGHTCCGQEERCDTPPCSSGGSCRRG